MAIKHIIVDGYGDVHKIVTGGYSAAEAGVAVAATEARHATTDFEAHDPGAAYEARHATTEFEAA